MDRAVSPNRQQVGISLILEQPADGIDSIGSLLEVHTTIRRNELSILHALEVEDSEDSPGVGQQNRPFAQGGAHGVQRLAEVDLAAPNGDDAPANELLQIEQQDLQAVRIILPEQPVPNNTITGRHCWLGLIKLRENLIKQGFLEMPHGPEFARLLERVARSMIIPSKQDYESVHCAHRDFPLRYEDLFQLVEEMTPHFSCPLDPGECLDRLLKDMAATASLMRGGDGIYVSKDRDQYARRLRSMAAHVLRYV